MPVWERIQESGVDHWADLPALTAWARNAADLASEDHERSLQDAGHDEQALTISRAIDALASMYRAANVVAPTEPRYLAVMRDTYGGAFDAGAGMSTGSGEGWIVRQSADVYRAVTGESVTTFKVYVRAWIDSSNQPHTACVVDGDAPSVCPQFAPSVAWSGRAHPGGGACTDPYNDWQCVAWSRPPGASYVALLPAAVWTLGVVRLIVGAVTSNPRGWLLNALRNGAQAMYPVDGDRQPPQDPSVDIASADRGGSTPSTTPTPPSTPSAPSTPSLPVSTGDVVTLGPVLLAGLLIGAVLLFQKPPSRRR